MAKENDDEYKVVAFKTLDDDDERKVELPSAIRVVQETAHHQVQQVTSSRSMQSIRKIAGSWSSFGDDDNTNDENITKTEQIAKLRNQLSAHHQQLSLASDRRMTVATAGTSTSEMMHASHQVMQQKQIQRISNFRAQTTGGMRASMEKQEFTNLQSIDESREISTSPIHLKVMTSRNRIQMHHVHTVQEFRSKM